MGRILDLIYPKNIYCICCNDFIDSSRIDGLCNSCIEKINWNTENRFKNVISDFAFDDVLSCCIYGTYPRTIIYKMKIHGSPYIAEPVAKLMSDRIRLAVSEDDLKADFLVPVPCTKKKKLQRGFNQAELISGFVSKNTGIQTINALVKNRSTKQSKKASGVERRFVQQGAFDIDEKLKESILNKNILLVDDVITTGSTADECARVLKNQGAAWVGVLCFASCSEAG